jgi:hypothetical protein
MKSTVLQYLRGSPYYPCMLLVSPDVAILEGAAAALADDGGWPLVSVGRALAEELLVTPPARWPRAAQRRLRQLSATSGQGPLVLFRVDVMFEPQLHLDPLVMFREMSRVAPLVATWPGEYDGNTLSYAIPEHTHYRTWRDPQVGILPLHP